MWSYYAVLKISSNAEIVSHEQTVMTRVAGDLQSSSRRNSGGRRLVLKPLVNGETEEVKDTNKVGHKRLPSFKKAPNVLCARFLVFSKTNGFYFCLEIARKIPKNIRGIWNYFGKNLSDFFWSSCLLYRINLISHGQKNKNRARLLPFTVKLSRKLKLT